LPQLDLDPPQLLGIEVADERTIVIRFSEPISLIRGSLKIDPVIEISKAQLINKEMHVQLLENQNAGKEYSIESTVRDDHGNRLKFISCFYGHNSSVPDICINEFSVRGSGKHPDLVELYASTGGDMAGVCLYFGSSSVWKQQFVFPSFEIPAGTYVLVHFKPEGIADEKDELEDMTVSKGYDSSAEAYDFWLRGGSGLSGNNGVLSLYSAPEGKLLDAVIYSNRTSTSDERYRGFGSRDMLDMVEEIMMQDGWAATEGEITPEDAITPEGSTGTRSICRDATSLDSNTRDDWHIAPTRGASFGRQNGNERYMPN